jgi:hypothetical protein
MLLPAFVSLLSLAILCDGRILLYDTEMMMSSPEKIDCIYVLDNVNCDYGGSSAGKIPYCPRPNITRTLKRVQNKCSNGGQMKKFVDPLTENIRPFEVLE